MGGGRKQSEGIEEMSECTPISQQGRRLDVIAGNIPTPAIFRNPLDRLGNRGGSVKQWKEGDD